jgi:hypothetical protein
MCAILALWEAVCTEKPSPAGGFMPSAASPGRGVANHEQERLLFDILSRRSPAQRDEGGSPGFVRGVRRARSAQADFGKYRPKSEPMWCAQLQRLFSDNLIV